MIKKADSLSGTKTGKDSVDRQERQHSGLEMFQDTTLRRVYVMTGPFIQEQALNLAKQCEVVLNKRY